MIVKALRNVLKMAKYEWFTTIDNVYDYNIVKGGMKKLHRAIKNYRKQSIKNAIVDTEFWEKYANINKSTSSQINDFLEESILNGSWVDKEYVISGIMQFGLDRSRAELIAKTELANISNKARELQYRDFTKVQKFKWKVSRDSKVCKKCREVEERTRNGVTLDELKQIIKDVGGDTAREWVVHPGCRCLFKRYYRKNVRWWE